MHFFNLFLFIGKCTFSVCFVIFISSSFFSTKPLLKCHTRSSHLDIVWKDKVVFFIFFFSLCYFKTQNVVAVIYIYILPPEKKKKERKNGVHVLLLYINMLTYCCIVNMSLILCVCVGVTPCMCHTLNQSLKIDCGNGKS